MWNLAAHGLMALETALLLAFLGLLFPPRREWGPNPFLWCAVASALSVDGVAFLLARWVGQPAPVPWVWLASFGVICGLCLYRCGPLQALGACALYYGALYGLLFLGKSLLRLLGLGPDDYGLPYHLLWFAALCALGALWLALRRRPRRDARYGAGFFLLCAMSLFTSCLLLAGTGAAAGVAQMVFVGLALALFLRHGSLRDAQERARLTALQAALLAKGAEELAMMGAENARKRHDFRNHLTVLKEAAAQKDWQTVAQYLDALEMPEAPRIAATGNLTADAVINGKYAAALEQGVSFSAELQIPPGLPVRPVDLCAILGNLLDNALEACRAMAEGDRRVVLKILGKDGFLLIRVSNTAPQNPLTQNPQLRSTKAGPGHGLGLASVRAALAPYRGGLTHEWRAGMLHALAILYLPETDTPPPVYKQEAAQ